MGNARSTPKFQHTHTHTRNSIAVIESNINYRFSKIPVYHFASKTTLDDKQKCVT